jgi:hypothetical protein
VANGFKSAPVREAMSNIVTQENERGGQIIWGKYLFINLCYTINIHIYRDLRVYQGILKRNNDNIITFVTVVVTVVRYV